MKNNKHSGKAKSETQKPAAASNKAPKTNGFEPVRRAPESKARTVQARYKKLFDLLQNGEWMTAAQLVERVGFCDKTIRRDITYMRDRMGLPIEEGQEGFRLTEPVDHFPGLEITAQELLALSVLCKAIALFGGAALAKPLQALFKKALMRLGKEDQEAVRFLERCILIRPYGVEPVNPETFEVTTSSLRKGRVMEAAYCKPEDTEYEVRRIEPYHLVEFLGRWYVIGFDHRAQDIRTFALGRMRNCRLLALKYEIPANFNAHKHFEKSLGIRTGKEHHKIEVELNRRQAGIQRGRQWHSSQTWKELPEGRAELSLQLSSLHEIEQTLLSWGTDATIKGPPPLCARFYDIGKDFVAKYGPRTNADTLKT